MNDKYAQVFPEENLIEGAVPFINSIPTRLESKTCISYHSVNGNKEEAKKTAEVIKEIKRISKPGRRVYSRANSIPREMNGLGLAILSTPKGVMSDTQARSKNVGGEILCYIY